MGKNLGFPYGSESKTQIFHVQKHKFSMLWLKIAHNMDKFFQDFMFKKHKFSTYKNQSKLKPGSFF
ncbi:hypothetical protein CAT59_00225 [Acinetobacter pittii]|jgi:hypothetical protein|uniref:Uncharacterized protein n=1 Tax=Acinetobacter pittii TaxID=48296 RepID=A0A0R0RQS2_ACIPI|nr:hypothetical protein APC53_02640 [Acinetobacter pittii]OTU31001.1 hypothetical protein CAT59_00225 [Acinetobacter pittii]HAV5002574.1 hypothetical protein [Acinetobacter baumannii]HAV5032278.1 hypothetical protein [Acinetobacter baumannii]